MRTDVFLFILVAFSLRSLVDSSAIWHWSCCFFFSSFRILIFAYIIRIGPMVDVLIHVSSPSNHVPVYALRLFVLLLIIDVMYASECFNDYSNYHC